MKTLIFLIVTLAVAWPATAQRTCTTVNGHIAAINEKYLDQAIRYAVDKDAIALQKLIDAGVIVVMKAGIKVFVVETHVLSGKVEIRVSGQTDVLWTVTEGIKCN